MISATDLSEEQKAAIGQWAQEGAQLPDIQKRLTEDFGLAATYMDTRFLVLDLGIEIQSEEEEEEEERDDATAAEAEGTPLLEGDDPPAGTGTVVVTTDELARPGALVSGKVVFSDGVKALWMIDQMGRLALDADVPGYQPTEADALSFERELRRLLDQ